MLAGLGTLVTSSHHLPASSSGLRERLFTAAERWKVVLRDHHAAGMSLPAGDRPGLATDIGASMLETFAGGR